MLFQKSLESMFQSLEDQLGKAPPAAKEKIFDFITGIPAIDFNPKLGREIMIGLAKSAGMKLDIPHTFDLQELLSELASCLSKIAKHLCDSIKDPVSPIEASTVLFVAYTKSYLWHGKGGNIGVVAIVTLTPESLKKIQDSLGLKNKQAIKLEDLLQNGHF